MLEDMDSTLPFFYLINLEWSTGKSRKKVLPVLAVDSTYGTYILPQSGATSEGVRRKLEAIEKRKMIRPAFEGMWLSLQDRICRLHAALWFAPVAMC
jgi:hypothetical protein